jgi:2-hydroxychromene-2-carboxylate isomerase
VPDDGVLEVHHHQPDPASGQPVFYYDLSSPEAYLAAERTHEVLGLVPEWQPVLLSRLPAAGTLDAFRCAEERDIYMTELERCALARGMQPLRWPPGWPADSELAMLIATYAKQIGRVVAFSLAAFRQAFAAGRDLSNPDNVVIAAAACEMHPAAVLKAAELQSVHGELARATEAAAGAGVTIVPAVRIGSEVFEGDDGLDAAAAAIDERAPA